LVSFHLSLPRDEASVPITRRLIAQSLDVVGVERDTISDLEVALSEACANVLRHAQVGDVYEVLAGFDEERAFLEVVDQGEGFDPETLASAAGDQGAPGVDADAESGRGVALMRALMDEVHFQRRETTEGAPGSSVVLEKRLQWRPDAVTRHLSQGPTPSALAGATPKAEHALTDPG
jgi:serine/threonine-protein kinase RsbW